MREVSGPGRLVCLSPSILPNNKKQNPKKLSMGPQVNFCFVLHSFFEELRTLICFQDFWIYRGSPDSTNFGPPEDCKV